jgi:UDP-N-acetylmuramoyl-L-alanyl-D-glutamate--2,6-diaminopimelate ligase
MIADVSPTLRPRANRAKSLGDLIGEFSLGQHGTVAGVEISGITVSTADVRPGDLFVAMRGARRHGAELAQTARENGAVAILTDPAGVELAEGAGLPIAVAPEPRAVLGAVSAWIYGNPGEGLTLFGVTGTNGKTSTVYFIEAILRQLGVVTGLSSTAERHIGGVETISGLTTPEASELQALLARMKEDAVTAVAIEVSAQALTRHRVDGTIFDVAGFTNLSHDHLDDYGDMRAYLEAKAGFFQPERARRAVISLDSEWAAELIRLANIPVTTFSSHDGVDADWRVEVTNEEPRGVSFTLRARDGRSLSTILPVIGRHMAANAGLAIAMLCEGGYELDDIAVAVQSAGQIDVYLPGRSERISGDRGPSLFVDFGHSPDAFENTLAAVRTITRGKVIMVFGADGDRDASKRPAMSRAAVLGSDVLIVTDHHPRFEDPASIRAALLTAARETDPRHQILEVADPKQAIREAVKLAADGDSILWAGPGHQNYRDIEGVHTAYSARYEARCALEEAGWL